VGWRLVYLRKHYTYGVSVPSPLCGIATSTPIFATLEFSHLFLMHRVELKD